MPRGISVHIGVNSPDGLFGATPLEGCRRDAESMRDIAVENGFEATIFLDDAAKFEDVKAAVKDAANRLQAGDIFLFTFAGHGSFRSTVAIEENDGQDETILLHDCVLLDNYLRRNLWSQFAEGVRILGIADSCHSGTVLTGSMVGLSSGVLGSNLVVAGVEVPRFDESPAFDVSMNGGSGAEFQATSQPVAIGVAPAQQRGVSARRIRGFTDAERERFERARPKIHERLRKELLSGEAAKVKASLLSLAACRDNEEALDGPNHGAFTQALLDVWNEESFNGNYDDFIGQIRAKIPEPSQQRPIRRPPVVESSFLQQRPFTI